MPQKEPGESFGASFDMLGTGIGLAVTFGGAGAGTLIGLARAGMAGMSDGAQLGGVFGLLVGLYIHWSRKRSGMLGVPGRQPRVGDYLDGWRILGITGSGGYKYEVCDARHEHGTMRLVDLRRGVGAEEAVRRLEYETRVLKALDTPYVASVLAAGHRQDVWYLVSQHLPDRPLRRRVDAAGPVSGEALFQIAGSSIKALAALHESGTAHGDVSPDTITVVDGLAMLAGLGDRTRYEQPYRPDPRAAAFLAPEQSAAGAPSREADVFAWAASMRFAATGQQPTSRLGALPAGYSSTGEPEVSGCPKWLSRVLLEALARDPEARPDARRIADELDRVASDAGWLLREPGPPRAARPSGSKPRWLPVTALLGLIGCIAIAAFTPAGAAQQPVRALPPNPALSPSATVEPVPPSSPASESPSAAPTETATTQTTSPTTTPEPGSPSLSPSSSPADAWPTSADDGSIVMNEYFGSEFYIPDWESCDATYCITGDGGAKVFVYTEHPIKRIKQLNANVPSPYAELVSSGLSTTEARILLKMDS